MGPCRVFVAKELSVTLLADFGDSRNFASAFTCLRPGSHGFAKLSFACHCHAGRGEPDSGVSN